MTNHLSHSKSCFMPPWSDPTQWQAANDAMAGALIVRPRRFRDMRRLANRIMERQLLVGRFMDALCADTCHGCTDNCCQRATVWYDFKDLLGLHLGAVPIPVEQLIHLPERPCRHLGMTGCELPRIQRPFICTWYLCAAQQQAMVAWAPSRKQFLGNSLMALKSGRNRMERLFIDGLLDG